ncbi:DUF4266 domain-containing protein [Candidatus Nitrosacidococcus sp. I8]|uniref:DUF4266 domain-containing protein n=1 Tax=Candidatus Nitrosacidococcus sp. I8 TaxID=2942908 RepID=UPI002225FAE5|nr:DUF4266 domain-containing protein [Candidatus Nitrosacidococcus sp. I8]CAH9017702.1 hypothetical protein NURINAE_00505 [Candidatus Nitrosacidococcus sp. I8]
MKKYSLKKQIKLTLPLLLLLISEISGCSQVAPWERGNLAQPHMAPSTQPLQDSWKQQVTSGREAAAGGGSTTGGGCGCY